MTFHALRFEQLNGVAAPRFVEQTRQGIPIFLGFAKLSKANLSQNHEKRFSLVRPVAALLRNRLPCRIPAHWLASSPRIGFLGRTVGRHPTVRTLYHVLSYTGKILSSERPHNPT